MANEYKQHLQCQTCYVRFNSNHDLLDHIEGYRSRERLLLAELERCRMHLEKSNNEEQENDGPESPSPLDSLTCPYKPCSRNDPYTSRGNLARHFQTHVDCYETCPFCFLPITKVHQYNRHHHESNSDDPRSIFMGQRIINFNTAVSRDLDHWQERRSAGKRAQMPHVSEQAQKKKKTAPVSVRDDSLYSETSYQHNSLAAIKATIDTVDTAGTAAEQQCEMIPTTHTNDHVHAQETSITNSHATGLPQPHRNCFDGGWPPQDATTGAITNMDWSLGEWAFAIPTADSESKQYPLGEWAFATNESNTTTNNTLTLGDWAFAQTGSVTPAHIPTNEGSVPLDAASKLSFVPASADSARENAKQH